MRIRSKFKDYYDGVQSFGTDATLVFNRFEEIIGLKELTGYSDYLNGIWESYLPLTYINVLNEKVKAYTVEVEFLSIGFCGKFYPCISFVHIHNNVELKRRSTYSEQSTRAYIDGLRSEFGKIELVEAFEQSGELSMDDLGQYFDHNVYTKEYLSWFQEANTPIFRFIQNPNLRYDDSLRRIVNQDNLIYVQKNIHLKEYDFYKVVDAYTAYQELSLFLGGVLSKRESINDNLSDIDKVKQHGFDLKYGFRKRPEKGD